MEDQDEKGETFFRLDSSFRLKIIGCFANVVVYLFCSVCDDDDEAGKDNKIFERFYFVFISFLFRFLTFLFCFCFVF